MPTLKNPRPEAVHLAEYLMAKRRAGWAPLHGEVLAGFKLAAWAHGYGVDGRYKLGVGPPLSIFREAGYLVFVGEGWNAPPVARPRVLTRRAMRRRKERERVRAA